MADNFPLFSGSTDGGSNNVIDRYSSEFGNPFYHYATNAMPDKIEDVFKLAEHLWLTDSTYKRALQRVVRYFLTSVELKDVEADEKEKWDEFLYETLDVTTLSALIGDDFVGYGNSFTSVYVPFRRYLVCPKCLVHRPIENVQYSFENFRFLSKCPACGYDGEFRRIDRRTAEQDRLKIIRWPVQEMKLIHNPVSQMTTYEWQVNGNMKKHIEAGTDHFINSTPWEIIDTIKNKKDLFRFNSKIIYHMKDETLSGVPMNGWGLPPILSSFKQAWVRQVLRRYNEAIALDYIVPFRLISPGKNAGSADPLIHQDLGDFVRNIQSQIKDHRRDPTSWHVVPHPVEYNPIGGEGNILAPHELLQFEDDELLNGLGVPAELYRGTLDVQAAPTALRLFERTWTSYVTAQNAWLRWLADSCADLLNWERVSGRWQPVMLAEDMEKKQVQLELAAGMQISRGTAYAPFGIDYREEIRRMFQEEKFFQDEQKRFEGEQAQRQELEQQMADGGQQGQAGPQVPGMPAGMPGSMGAAPGGAGGPVTPDGLAAQSEEIAYQLLAMPYEARRSQLIDIKQSNKELHAQVMGKMQEIRDEAASQGKQEKLQQLQGPAAV